MICYQKNYPICKNQFPQKEMNELPDERYPNDVKEFYEESRIIANARNRIYVRELDVMSKILGNPGMLTMRLPQQIEKEETQEAKNEK